MGPQFLVYYKKSQKTILHFLLKKISPKSDFNKLWQIKKLRSEITVIYCCWARTDFYNFHEIKVYLFFISVNITLVMDQFNYRNPIVNVKYINVGMKLLNFRFIYVDILMFEKNYRKLKCIPLENSLSNKKCLNYKLNSN